MSVNIRDTIAANVHRIRKAKGLTQAQLAEAAGIVQTYVGQIERNGRNLTIDVVEALAAGLDVSVLELLTPQPSEPGGHAQHDSRAAA